MLTNNKNFVRSIAMLLAVLMVMALCLTGCGNKAADEALTKAEEAKTLADEVNAALAGYLKTADAEATVKALVDAALADGAATKAEIAELSAQLANYVTLAQVEALITEKVAAGALEGVMTKAEIEEILADYYTKEDINDMFDNYFGEFEAEQVLAILTDADKAMNKGEWDKATAVVLATIENLQTLLESLETKTYTQANMAAVNECLAPFGIAAFEYDAEEEMYEALKGGDTKTVATLLEYAILRQATVEDMTALEAAVAAAVAVPTFESSFAALKADLYALGDLYVVGDYTGLNNTFKPAKYTTNDFYHGEEVKKGDEKKVQIVTLADKAGFHAFEVAYDELVAEYTADIDAYEAVYGASKATDMTKVEGWLDGTVSALYETTTLTAGVSLLTQAVTADAPQNSRLIGYTMLNTNDHKDYLSKVYQNKAEANEVLKYPLFSLTTDVAKSAAITTDYKATNTFKSIWNDLSATHDEEANPTLWNTVYTLVYRQLKSTQALADTANTTYNTFLADTVKANTLALVSKKDIDAITDAEFLAALTDEMCEPIVNSTITAPHLLNEVFDDVEAFMVANGQAYDETVGGFVRSALYEDMMDKTFDLLWDNYKVQAIEWANIILKDYISVAYEAKNNDAGKRVGTALPTLSTEGAISALAYANTGDLAAAMTTAGEKTTAAELTDGFLKAFVSGEDLTGLYATLGLKDKFNGNALIDFYINNGAAQVSTVVVGTSRALTAKQVYANPMVTIAENAENIRQRLTGSMTRTELAIAQADMATEKAKGGSVRTAFYGLLTAGVEDLDEIYARFLFEDYKLMTLNNMTVKAEAIVDFYNIYNTAKTADQKAMVKRYLTGLVDAATYEKGIKVEWNKDDKGNNTTVKSTTYKANDMESSLTNGYLLTQITPITADKWAASNGTITEKNAAAKMAEVVAITEEITTNLENMLIKYNFLDYLQEARGNVVAANVEYTTYLKTLDATNWDTMIKLNVENNTADDQITVAEFYFNKDTYKLADYKEAYKNNILSLVADKDNLHLALFAAEIDELVELGLAGQKVYATAVYDELLKDVKSSNADITTWVVGPYVPAIGYEYVGTYAVALDRIMNAEFKTSSYKDAAGNIVPL